MADSPLRNRPLLLGHRGARSRKSLKENSLPSFDQALADGCDGFEFDVRLTADDVSVVCHDPQCHGIKIAGASVKQLQDLPRLQEVLIRYEDRAFLDIELKVPGLEKITIALLRKHPPQRGLVLSSFLPEVLEAVRGEDASLPLGLICEKQAELGAWAKLPVKYVIPHHKLVEPALIEELKSADKKILTWTVNAAADMRRFARLGVDGIISDDTSLLCRTLGSLATDAG
jgi:glycerophosphoryl diester phosphodiesterase